MYHIPVLLKESVNGLAIKPNGIYVDVTYGGGSHSKEILSHLDQDGKLMAFDQDEDAIDNKSDDPRLLFINQNFRYMKNFLRLYNAMPADGILADLGVSSHQFDSPERGFSIRTDGLLDLRMDNKKSTTAAYVINNYSENELLRIFREFGEIDNANHLAKTIVLARKTEEIKTINQFKTIIDNCIDKRKENKYLAQVFQALRIEVNAELEALKEMLKQTVEVLKPGGRIVIISYHSLEDRLVKNFMRSGNFEGKIGKDFFGNINTPFKIITRKPIVPTEEEVNKNSRARSAKLRIAEKI